MVCPPKDVYNCFITRNSHPAVGVKRFVYDYFSADFNRKPPICLSFREQVWDADNLTCISHGKSIPTITSLCHLGKKKKS